MRTSFVWSLATVFLLCAEGFAVYAAFSEAALAFAAEGKLDAQQIGALNGLLKSVRLTMSGGSLARSQLSVRIVVLK